MKFISYTKVQLPGDINQSVELHGSKLNSVLTDMSSNRMVSNLCWIIKSISCML